MSDSRIIVCRSAAYAVVAWVVALASMAGVTAYAAHANRLGPFGVALLLWALVLAAVACIVTVGAMIDQHRSKILDEVALQMRMFDGDGEPPSGRMRLTIAE